MASYRFCRPDDIPLLVAAVNRCFDVHFPASPPFTVEELRREMRHLQLWPSNSMVATAGSDPVAVVIGTKRPREVLVRRIGVAPGHQRQGHGRHLLGSLANKLAVLGPSRLITEVPAELAAAGAFFAAAGWEPEATLLDFRREAPLRAVPPELFASFTVDELDAQGLLPARLDLPWERQPESLRAGGTDLVGLALLGEVRWEAWAVYRELAGGGSEVLSLGGPWLSAEPSEPASEGRLALLCDGLQAHAPGPLRLARLLADELAPELLARLGFSPAGARVRYAVTAVAA
jgi:GNAT superfamily N-acetyltransferase